MERTTIRYILTDPTSDDDHVRFEPTKAHADDAAYDLRSVEAATLLPNERRLVNVGIALAIPEGYAGQVLPRSGLALKSGITVLNAPGLIDPGYRGDVGVILWNTGHTSFRVEVGDRIAQLLFVKVAEVELRHSAWLPHSERADAGFGSTGR